MAEGQSVAVVSVGGSEQPIIYSLNERQPEFIIYFTSQNSRRIVRQKIEPALKYRPEDHEIITTPDEQNLVASVEILLRQLPAILSQWNVDFDCVIGDYTGGTKTMSSAVVMALAGKGCRYSYVGGTARDKGGLGVVIDGREQQLYLQNPWDVLAIDALRDIHLLFNGCRFRAVQDLAEQTARRVDEKRLFFLALKDISEGFYRWDNFQYAQALNLIKRGMNVFHPFVEGHSGRELRLFYTQVASSRDNLEMIQKDTLLFKSNLSKKEREVVSQADGRATVIDLLANAVRRAEVDYKFEDAVARLYSAIEKMAKVRLKVAYQLDNSDLDIERLPRAMRDDYLPEEPGEKIQLPLHRSYALLAGLGDPLGESYLDTQDELRKALNVRNMSLLAHGFEPVTEKTYRNLLEIALTFMGLKAEDLPRFPRMQWDGDLL
jgi:CRISPR-associated protein (TIGR02710 family)